MAARRNKATNRSKSTSNVRLDCARARTGAGLLQRVTLHDWRWIVENRKKLPLRILYDCPARVGQIPGNKTTCWPHRFIGSLVTRGVNRDGYSFSLCKPYFRSPSKAM